MPAAPALAGKALVYVTDPVDAFFLQVQGSGRVELADGSILRLGYADQNGQPYRSIARVLIDRGEMTLDQASMQSIRALGHRTSRQARGAARRESELRVLSHPARAGAGIAGSADRRADRQPRRAAARAARTIAVDPHAIPLGAPVWLATTRPLSDEPLQRLVMAQDTGGAIRGPVRADFFWGFGDEAGREAGRMRQQGRMWLLWPAGATPPAAN